ncbi:hypothetical protein MMC30_002860 [Trapelia coarctata]|nr:hypothetical protein [Trapelia coarctata]
MPEAESRYVSNGHVLSSPPLSVRFRGFIDSTVLFLGLYLTTLFSLDAYAAGQASAYNINNRVKDGTRTGKGFFGGGGGGGGGSGGGGPGPGSGGGGGRKLGTVDQIRAPESDDGKVHTGFSQDDWAAVIDAAEKKLPEIYEKQNAPEPGSVQLAKYIDHTLLKLDATEEQIDQLCKEAKEYNFKVSVSATTNIFASVCVRLNYVPHAINNLRGSTVDVACVVGFHEGTQSTSDKVTEALQGVTAGASELDIVLNHHLLNSQSGTPPFDEIFAELATLRSKVRSPVILKLILETSQLSRHNAIAACVLAQSAGFDFVKTSTGFNGQGATLENVKLMKAVVGEGMGVKASGGVRSLHDCVKMIEAGAERIGTSSGVAIMREGVLTKTGVEKAERSSKTTKHEGSDY